MKSQTQVDYFDPYGEVVGAEALPLDQAIAQFKEFHSRVWVKTEEPRVEAVKALLKEAKRVEVCLFRSVMEAGQ